MLLSGWLGTAFRLAAAVALVAFSEAAPTLVPGSAAGENRSANRPLLGSLALGATPRPQNFARAPLCFEANQGQTDAQVKYLARGPGYTVFLTATEAVLALRPVGQIAHLPRAGGADKRPASQLQPAVVRLQLIDSNPVAVARGADPLPGIVNYFRGNDPSKWRTHVPIYARVQYQDVYPGIDLVYYGNPQQLEYDLVVGPGADPSQIRLRFAGAQRVSLNADGDLLVQAGDQVLLQSKPVAYQQLPGERREVAAGFVLQGQEVSFALGSFDRSRPLVVDPVLSYSTYLGGSSSDSGNAIAVDAAGNAYVTGYTTSPDFPTANALQPNLGGQRTTNAFVAKLTADGSALVYATYLGGSGGDTGSGIAVDATGNVYVTGTTGSVDFPTANALQPHYGGGDGDAFVAKLATDGSALLYYTYLGGSGTERGNGLGVDAAGNAYVTGATQSPDFPIANALQSVLRSSGNYNAFVAKLSADGTALVYSTYLGGSNLDRGLGIAVDGAGNAYVTGLALSLDFPTVKALQPACGGPNGNAFVAVFNADGSALVYATYLGGSGPDGDSGNGIAGDAAGNAYVTGFTTSADFPTVKAVQPKLGGRGARNAFVAKLSSDGSALVYATYLGGGTTYLGGRSGDTGSGIAVDAAGNAYVTGKVSTIDFPTANPLQHSLGSADGNAFVAELSADGQALVYATYLGGSGSDSGNGIAVDAAGNAYVTGYTWSPNFPTTQPFQPTLGSPNGNAFVARISP